VFQQLKDKIPTKYLHNRLAIYTASAIVASIAILAVALSTHPAYAACAAPATDYGSATQTVSVTSAGTYRIWSRIMVPSATSSSYMLEVDGGTCYTVGGGSAIPANTWTWVSYQNGTTTSLISPSLTAGTHSLKLIGNAAGVKVDRLLLLSDTTCTPTGTGDNCLTVPPPPPSNPPTVTMSAAPTTVTQGQAVTLSVTATDTASTVTSVSFYDGSTLIGTDSTSPYSVVWNTNTATTIGSHSLTAKATDAANLTGTSTAVSVTVNAAPVSDNTPPTVSFSVPANGSTVSGNAVTLSATATDNVKVASVTFSVNGVTIGSPVTTPTANNTYSVTWDTTPLPDGTYTVVAKAVDTSPSGNPATTTESLTTSNVVTPPKTDTTPPTVTLSAPPQDGTVSGKTVTLSATATDNVKVANVTFSVDGTYVAAPVTTPTGSASNTYSITWDSTSVSNGSHTIKASAVDTSGNSSDSQYAVTVSNGDTQAPSAPTNLAAAAAAFSQVNLSWTASKDNVAIAGYYVIRNGSTIAKTTGIATTYSDTTVTGTTTYTYSVEAYDAAGNISPSSSTVSVTTPDKPDTQAPTWPTGTTGSLAATAVSTSQVNLSWSAATDNVAVKSYEIFRNNSTTPIATVATNTYGDSGLSASTTYTYTVKAVDAAGNLSVASNTASATTQAVPPPPPNNPPPTSGNGVLQGFVYGGSTNNPLGSASVEINYRHSSHYYYTNRKGLYIANRVPAGSYNVGYYAHQYNSKFISVTITANKTTSQNETLTRR